MSPQGKGAAEKHISNRATQALTQSNEPSLSATDQAFLIAPPIDTPSDKDAGIAHGQSMTPSLSATDQELPFPHDEMPTEAIVKSPHAGSDPIAMERLDENNDDDDIPSSQSGKRSDDTSKDDGDKKSGGIGTSMIIHPQSRSHESHQQHGSMDTTTETTANSQPLTKKLLESGGDIRALLLSSQPLSSFLASTTTTTGGKSAEQQIASKVEAEEDEEEEGEAQEERFVRPRRLRRAVSKEAASDGFPSAIALSHRWHPDHMQDLPRDTNLSIRDAFDNKHDEYYVFRHWRPSQGR